MVIPSLDGRAFWFFSARGANVAGWSGLQRNTGQDLTGSGQGRMTHGCSFLCVLEAAPELHSLPGLHDSGLVFRVLAPSPTP